MRHALLTQRVLVGATVFLLALASLLFAATVNASTAAAADPPTQQRAETGVTADGLPTVQIDGVVWDQAIVGDTVYAGGQFSYARPAGAAPGTNQVARSNLLAYNIRTGVLITSFAPTINGQVKDVAVSPDGSRIYIGGSFTLVNGVGRYRLAAFSTATGALVTSFAAGVNAGVSSIAVTDTAVYVGGAFSTVGSSTRSRLAAFSPTNGALLGWAPSANAGVNALVLTPDKSRVIVAGSFSTLNASTATGIGAIDAVTGATLPWAANNTLHNYGANAAMLSLSTDGTNIYSAGYWFGGTGNFEGILAADPNTGNIKWLADCHGDTYDASAVGNVVYAVSHWHHCSNIGAFPDTNPRTQWYRSTAVSTEAQGTVRPNTQCCYADFQGQGAPGMVNWFPTMDVGSFTGQGQAGWTTEGTSEYVVQGGEFPRVNGVAQQGLVRFAIPSLAPKKQGPRLAGATINPTLLNVGNTSVRVKWQTNWDRDDQVLYYDVFRQGSATPVNATPIKATSQFWKRPSLSITDSNVVAGQSYSYRIAAYDGDGNRVLSEYVPITVAETVSPYLSQVLADGASSYWRMSGTTTTYPDYVDNADLLVRSGTTANAGGALNGEADGSATVNGTSEGMATTTMPMPAPSAFTAEAWFNTTSTTGGKILGFSSSVGSLASKYDRHIYMGNTGKITYGVNANANRYLTSASSYNDGKWHHVAAQLSSAGMVLYIDGLKVGSNTGVTTALAYDGYWRVGGDNLSGWPDKPTNPWFKGSIDEVAIYPTALTAAQIQDHFTKASAVAVNKAPVAAFTSTCTNGACTFDGTGSTDPDGTVASYAWTFGDGDTSQVAAPTHSFTTSGTYTVSLTVTDNLGATNVVTKSVVVSVPANQPPSAVIASTCNELDCTFDGTGSTDPDGSVEAYAWNFGDGATSTLAQPAHAYTAAGTYPVTLEVTDGRGGTDTATKSVVVTKTAAGNQDPTAAFTSTVSDLTASFDASGSSDPDGTIASYAWTFGDGSSGTGRTPSKTYAGTGSYSVKLTVTDNAGATTTTTKSVSIGASPIVADDFNRTVTRWGTADTGGAWTHSGTTFSTNGSTGDVKLGAAGAGATASLTSVSTRDLNMVADIAYDSPATGGGTYTTFITRKVGTSDYRMTLRETAGGALRLNLTRTVGGTGTSLRDVVISGVTYNQGDTLRVRFTASGNGTTALAAKVWKVGTPEPATAQVTASDTTAALQAAGSFAIYSYLSGSATTIPTTVMVDNLRITAP